MPDKDLAPVVLFIYNRPKHTEQTLESLKKNKLSAETILYVFADGPKSNATAVDKKNITDTRQLLKTLTGFKQVITVEKEKNEGLATSVISGVTEIINKHGKVIVLEDDLLLSSYFLEYMNQGLSIYNNVTNVYSINAYMFPIVSDKTDTFLSPLATSSWGWATWADKWSAFEKEIKFKEVIRSNPFIRKRFNFSDYNYADTLEMSSSWAIKWYYSVFIRNGLGVFPTRSLVQNIGFDGSGTHGAKAFEEPVLFEGEIKIEKKQVIDMEYYAKMLDFFKEKKTSIFSSISKIIKKN
ncbi:MAG: glycosyltransferase family 2 protein [Bacteroidetes bacterium]|nr:glycosyltransferase family 2 protein [Bacteroidota bacterium]